MQAERPAAELQDLLRAQRVVAGPHAPAAWAVHVDDPGSDAECEENHRKGGDDDIGVESVHWSPLLGLEVHVATSALAERASLGATHRTASLDRATDHGAIDAALGIDSG